MWCLVVALTVWIAPPQAPYVACKDGHIAATLADCPTVKPPTTVGGPYGGGAAPRGGGGGGLLGGLLGGIL